MNVCSRRVPFVLALALGCAATAQYEGEGPGVLVPLAPRPELGPAVLGNGIVEVGQLLLTPHTSLGRDRRYLCATVRTGASWDVITGIYSTLGGIPRFTKNNDVDHLNSPSDEFALTVSPDLLVVALDTPPSHPIGAGRVVFARRSVASGPFSYAQPVQNIPPGYRDPQIMMVGGELMLAYIDPVGDLVRAPFDTNIGALDLARQTRLVAKGIGPDVHSPSPMTDAEGNAFALIYSRNTNAAQPYFRSSLDETAPEFALPSLPGAWMANPDADGGTITYATAPGTTYVDPQSFGVLAVSSANLATPTTMLCTVFAPKRQATEPQYFTTLAFGTLAPGPIHLSGVGGSPLSIVPMVVLPEFAPLDRDSGATTIMLDTPRIQVEMNVVPIVLDPATQRVFLGNTGICRLIPSALGTCVYHLPVETKRNGCLVCPGAPHPAIYKGATCGGVGNCTRPTIKIVKSCSGAGTCTIVYTFRGCERL